MDEVVCVAVTNIPFQFHASDLRAHFSALVESNSFSCFHYRHRPEKQNSQEKLNLLMDTTLKRCCCIVKVNKSKLQSMLQHDGGNWVDCDGNILKLLCSLSVINSEQGPINSTDTQSQQQGQSRSTSTISNVSKNDAINEEMISRMPELNPPAMMPKGNVGTPTLVFLDLIQRCLLPQTFVKKLRLKFPKTQSKRLYACVNFNYTANGGDVENVEDEDNLPSIYSAADHDGDAEQTEVKDKTSSAQSSPQSKYGERKCSPVNRSCNETHDNDSTQSLVYDGCDHDKRHNIVADRIRKSTGSPECTENSKMKSNENMNSKQSCETTPTSSSSDSNKSSTCIVSSCTIRDSHEPEGPVRTQNSCDTVVDSTNKNIQEGTCVFRQPASKGALSARDRKRREKAERRSTQKLMDEGIEERLIALDRKYHNDEDAEEWDRHEASEDDPSNQERNTERLYEQEEETPWEKGGPGVVFYTDAMFWQAREGDFDEKTTDDLDVDFSPYEEGEGGDKDIKDFLRIRQEERFRSGYDSTDRFSIGIARRTVAGTSSRHKGKSSNKSNSCSGNAKIGKFEKFTKGIGRRVMEKQGWSDGRGLGRAGLGRKDALHGEGQRPHNKQGLGYTKPPLPMYQSSSSSTEASRISPPLTSTETAIRSPSIASTSTKKRRRQDGLTLISTAYDNPRETDPKTPLLQRSEPSTLKHRQSHLDKF